MTEAERRDRLAALAQKSIDIVERHRRVIPNPDPKLSELFRLIEDEAAALLRAVGQPH